MKITLTEKGCKIKKASPSDLLFWGEYLVMLAKTNIAKDIEKNIKARLEELKAPNKAASTSDNSESQK